jgi:hypothetical protein
MIITPDEELKPHLKKAIPKFGVDSGTFDKHQGKASDAESAAEKTKHPNALKKRPTEYSRSCIKQKKLKINSFF